MGKARESATYGKCRVQDEERVTPTGNEKRQPRDLMPERARRVGRGVEFWGKAVRNKNRQQEWGGGG